MLLFQFSSYTTVVEAEQSQLVRVCVSEEEECVCQQVTVCVCVCARAMFTYLCGNQQPLWGQNPRPYEFGGIFETQNVF